MKRSKNEMKEGNGESRRVTLIIPDFFFTSPTNIIFRPFSPWFFSSARGS